MPKEKSLLPAELAELAARRAQMSDEELAELRIKLVEFADQCEQDLTDDNLNAMDEVATVVEDIKQIVTAREEDRAERQEKAAQIRSRIAPAASTESETEETAEVEQAEQAEVEEEKVAVAASSESTKPVVQSVREPEPSLSEIQSRTPGSMIPRQANSRLTITAAADVPGFSAGSRFDDPKAVAEAFANKWEAVYPEATNGQRFPVARFKVEYPEDRTLTRNVETNTEKVAEVLADVRRRAALAEKDGIEAVIASGGLCAPVDVHYGLAQIATDDRPFRDSLPRFATTRGGVQFVTPPTMTDVADGVRVTTEAQDAARYTTQDPAGSTAPKPVVEIDCGTLVTETVDAVSLRIQSGNFNRFAFPEQWDAWYANGKAWHARVAEGNLLARLANNSRTLNITEGTVLSTARDLFETHRKHAAQYRNRFRMGYRAPMQFWMPAHVIDQIAADIMFQQPGDGLDTFKISEAWVRSVYASFNATVDFYEDEKTGGDQIYDAQTDDAAGLPWLTTIEWYMAHPGAIVYFEAGTLDFGIDIRDTGLLGTNDVQSFFETFEGLAVVGFPPVAGRSTVCVGGKSSLPIDIDCPNTGS